MLLLKKLFNNKKIVGLAGSKNTGKTNNLVYLIKNFREHNKITPIYAYGMPKQVMDYLKKLGVIEISSLRHLIKKKDCLIIIDEFQKLKLNDRRYKETLSEFVDFIYHNNASVILSTPNIREFNSIIGGVIERWILKDIRVDQCINGSQLKKVVEEYQGSHKELGSISVKKSQILVIDESEEVIINCAYVSEADNKKANLDIFCQENVGTKLSKKKSKVIK